MRPESKDTAHLWDIKITAEGVVKSTHGIGFEDYLNDENLRLATERRIEIIGEAANRISEGFRLEHQEIPWKLIIAQRHVLAHDYADIDDRLIWAVVTQRIPELISLLEKLDIDPP